MDADFSGLDRPEILMVLFHPRRDYGTPPGRPPKTATGTPRVQDILIPFSDGRALFDACPSPAKTLLKIPGANHNDILARAFENYLSAIQRFTSSLITI